MNNLDNIGQTFQWAGQRYMAIMQPFAEKIFLGLVLIEIIITCVHFLADQDEPTRLLAELVKKSLALGFLYAMIVNAPIWFSAIIQGFQQIGGQAAGIPGLSPSSAFNSGLALFQIIYRGFGSLGWFHVTLAALIALIAGLIMFLSFALIAAQMLLALCEAYVGAGGGVLLLGFSGSRWTIKFAEGFLGWIVGVGIKVFFLYLMVGIGLTITAGWNTALIGWTAGDPSLPLTIAGGAMIFALLAWTIPNTAASIVGGAVSLNLSHAFEAAMAGYGLGRILNSPKAAGAESGGASQASHSLGASLEAGDRAAANGAARPPSARSTVPMLPSEHGIASPTPMARRTAQTSLL
ncbi:MAG TPA: P-type conjugative transfer protein TrbL [Candidatus Binataceae bacterium]|nr:P-type conjugative transfer protein TrbL [Candidatus Binataceae bacterium]